MTGADYGRRLTLTRDEEKENEKGREKEREREAALFKPFEGKVKQEQPQKVLIGNCKTFLPCLNARRKSVSGSSFLCKTELPLLSSQAPSANST